MIYCDGSEMFCYICQGGRVFIRICLFVCLFVSKIMKTLHFCWFFTKLGGKLAHGLGRNLPFWW